MGALLKMVLGFAVALLFALATVVTVAVELLKEGEGQADAEPGSEDLPNKSLGSYSARRPSAESELSGKV